MPNPASTSHPPTTATEEETEESLEATMPGFRTAPSSNPRQPDPLAPDATIRPPANGDGPDFLSGPELDEPDDATNSSSGPSPKSSQASIDPNTAAFLGEVARNAVGIASIGIGWLRARRHGPAIAQAWLADEEDQANIGDPLARIAARRVPAVAGEAAPDVIDGLEAVMGTVSYGLKHARTEAEFITVAAQGVDFSHEQETPPQ